MYSSYGLTKAILESVYVGDQTELCRIISGADPEVLADEIFQIVGSLLYVIPREKRPEIEERLINESTRYDFETLVSGLRDRFTFPNTTENGG